MRPPVIVRRLRRRLGVRLRSALAAGLVVVVVSILAGVILLVTARGILLRARANINTAVNDEATQIATALAAGDTLTVAAALRPSARGRTVVQVLDAAGQISVESDAIAGTGPISPLRPGAGRRLQKSAA